MKTINAIFFVLFVLCVPIISFSQQNDKKFENGDVLISYIGTFHGRSFEVCKKPYSNYLLGVYYDDNSKVSKDPRMYKNPVKTKGITFVKYNSENGSIKAGDPVTSSNTQGVAMKATKSGMILGIALEDASKQKGLIKIRLLIQYIAK